MGRDTLKRVLLIDTDTLVYAAATRCEVGTDWGDGQFTLNANLDEGKSFFTNDLRRIIESAGAVNFRLAISDYYHKRWREDVLPTYKHNRTARRPLIYDALRQWIEGHPKAYQVPHLEGDDLLGIWMTDDSFLANAEKVCVSIDKDLKQIPGLLLNYQHARDDGCWEPTLITEQEADRFHFYQTLTGDAVDGYKGCPNVGPKRAEKLLQEGDESGEWWEIVRDTYIKKGLTSEDAIQQAQVARILRRTDYVDKEVVLWTP
jgi:DNA polymerase-1